MQHLGRADSVDDVDAEMALEALADLGRQRFAGGGHEFSATSSRAGRLGDARMPAKPVGAP